MDDKKTPQQMTVIESIERLEELKQKIVDEGYDSIIEEGYCTINFTYEQLEALEVILYYLNTLSEEPEQF